MAAFNLVPVASSEIAYILKATPKQGDAHPFDCPENGFNCVAFTVDNPCRVVDKAGEVFQDFLKGEKAELDALTGEAFTAVALEALTYYCIHPKDEVGAVTGEVHTVTAGQALTLSGVKGKRLFLATSSASINGEEVAQHRVCHFQNTDEVNITAPVDKELLFAVFYT